MFLKKKSLPPQNHVPNLGPLFIELATELYRGIGPADGNASLTATIEFDKEQRVSKIHNPKVNEQPKVPSFETLENLNKLSVPLKSLQKIYQLKSLDVSIKNGEINANPTYAAN